MARTLTFYPWLTVFLVKKLLPDMRSFYLLLLFAGLAGVILLFPACEKDCYVHYESGGKNINFQQLAVGQSARYLGLLGEKYYMASTDDYGYTDDTLVLTIVAQDANGFKVAEALHYQGDVDNGIADKDSTYYYYFQVQSDTLQIMPFGPGQVKSRIFTYFLRQQGLPLKTITGQKVVITGWKTSLPYCECRQEGYAENYGLFGVAYDTLNVLVDNSFMAVDGPGQTYVYSAASGIVRFSTYSWWTQSGYGWDLLPVP